MLVYRFERAPIEQTWDARGKRVLKELPLFFPKWKNLKDIRVFCTEIYWIHLQDAVSDTVCNALSAEILEDPLLANSNKNSFFPAPGNHQWWCFEKTFKPGVTDNPGHVLSEAIQLVTGKKTECLSGSRLWLELPTEITRQEVSEYANHVFYNDLIEKAFVWDMKEAKAQDSILFQKPTWIEIKEDKTRVESFDVAQMPSEELQKLSEEKLWALSLAELEQIQKYYKKVGRQATDVEIEVIAQTWSEHCKHKIFSAFISIKNEREDISLPTTVESVFKTYIKGATAKIHVPYLKSVFEDNAGIIQINQNWDCAIKVETHNSPSALDPYGGALTGIVGVNRDILGAGLGAYPIANLDVFCVGPLDTKEPLPPRLHHPRRILEGVRLGVEHGGNKSGIPTVTGAVVYHPGFLGKPLIFCGTIGLLPAGKDFIHKKINPGDHIVMAGGRIGKDGIHGATFSSLELNETSPVSAVQLGDPLTQKRLWDFLIEARDESLFSAVTDNGAGGLSSSVGELAQLCGVKGGAVMDVSKAKTKYPGLSPYELVVSESQERMTFAVPPQCLSRFLNLAGNRGVECSVLGEFEDSGQFHIQYDGKTVGCLDLDFLHHGVPQMQLEALVKKPNSFHRGVLWNEVLQKGLTLEMALPAVLSSPNVRSRHEIVEQYDHEVQARTVKKPYGTPKHYSPNDGATLRIERDSFEGLAVGLGLAPAVAQNDPGLAASLAMDEAMRNSICAGMDPSHAVFIDNFCWPDPLPSKKNPDFREKLGALVLSCERLFHGATTLGIPFVSGKDSMKNDYRMGDVKISVPPTVLITTVGKVHDVRCVPSGAAIQSKEDLNPRHIFWVSGLGFKEISKVDFIKSKTFFLKLHELIQEGVIESMHDVSDGGWLTATAEMLLGAGVGATLRLDVSNWQDLFEEPATSFVLFVKDAFVDRVTQSLKPFDCMFVGKTVNMLDVPTLSIELSGEKALWRLSDLEKAYGC